MRTKKTKKGSFAKRSFAKKNRVVVSTLAGERRTYPSGSSPEQIGMDYLGITKPFKGPKIILIDSKHNGYEGNVSLKPGRYTLIKIARKPLPLPKKG